MELVPEGLIGADEDYLKEQITDEEEEGWKQYYEKVLAEIAGEADTQNPVMQWMHGVTFISYSKGWRRNKNGTRVHRHRKCPAFPVLIQYGQDVNLRRWRWWSGEDHTDEGRNPWDKWASEALGEDFCRRLSEGGEHPDDYLRKQFLKTLRGHSGRF